MEWVKAKRLCSFTNKPYTGNPAWVIIGLKKDYDEKWMMRLAKELNPVSDTTFVFPDEEADLFLRFFSGTEEIKFSGHGTVATYYAIQDEGFLNLKEPITLIKQKTRSGIQSVELRVSNNKIQRVTISLPPPSTLSVNLEIKQIARFLGLSPVDISETGFPLSAVMTEHPEAIVPVKSLPQLLDITPNFSLMKNYCQRMGITGVVVFTTEANDPKANAHMRHFAPVVGINEDPTSGIAAVALGYYLVKNGIIPGEETTRIIVEQGYSQQMPGLVYVHVYTYEKEILRIAFGGQAVLTFEGRIRLP
uniref:PhzF family phenazine biosynthesis protein n=1 Tax=candidate division WOR-3 bacterium TaxID=2052148 RepID=A0A7V3RH75_UNCW3